MLSSQLLVIAAAPMASNLVELTGVSKIYKSSGGVKTNALAEVDLTIPRGDFVAVMGPSGSGKSTLMQIIGLLDKKFTGKYKLAGQDVSRLKSDQAAAIRSDKIGFVFQQFNLLKRASVMQNVLLPTTYRSSGDDHVRAARLLNEVGLADLADKRSNQLSGGQIQRVAIARALIMNPDLVLADEPTGNLDSKTGREIMELFCRINKRGTTIILITHEDEIAAYAKRTLQLYDGKLSAKRRKS